MLGTTMRSLNESTLLVGSKRGNLYEVSMESGEVLDSFNLFTEASITSIVVVNPQRVAVVTNNSLFIHDPSRNQGAVSFSPNVRFVAIRPADRSVHVFRLY
jgi:WD40 repeat protein